jgi:hypothetical protein
MQNLLELDNINFKCKYCDRINMVWILIENKKIITLVGKNEDYVCCTCKNILNAEMLTTKYKTKQKIIKLLKEYNVKKRILL